MAPGIACTCGYDGPGKDRGGIEVCPICNRPASGSRFAGIDAPGRGGSRFDGIDVPAKSAAFTGIDVPAKSASGFAGMDLRSADDQHRTYHIPCPKGHVHEVQEDWVGREFVCSVPGCNASFVLQAAHSVEFRREQRRRQEEADDRKARIWLTRAIVAAVLIGLLFVAMIVIAAKR
ncbi:MAG: hypothetical protein EBR23_06525 [Planctomycetia bacterium]|nr:hypothetical protein [Planctomycetia bacterium]